MSTLLGSMLTPAAETRWPRYCTSSVSYTHLDVYKRQDPKSVNNPPIYEVDQHSATVETTVLLPLYFGTYNSGVRVELSKTQSEY